MHASHINHNNIQRLEHSRVAQATDWPTPLDRYHCNNGNRALTRVVHAAHIHNHIESLDHFRVARANHVGARKPLRLLQQEAAERLVAAAGKVQVRRRQVKQRKECLWVAAAARKQPSASPQL